MPATPKNSDRNPRALDSRTLFASQGLVIRATGISLGESIWRPGDVNGYQLRTQPGSREPGLLVCVSVFAVLALIFLIPVLEGVTALKFLFAVVVFVGLTAMAMQDFITFRNRADTDLLLITPDGATRILSSSSNQILCQAASALETLGCRPHKPAEPSNRT